MKRCRFQHTRPWLIAADVDWRGCVIPFAPCRAVAFVEPTRVRETNPRLGFFQHGRIGFAEHGIDETHFGWADVLFGEFDSFMHGGVRRAPHEVQLIEAEMEKVHNDRARFLAGDGFDQVIEREALPEAAVEEFLHKSPVFPDAFVEQFISKTPRVLPSLEEFESGLPGGHPGKASIIFCDEASPGLDKKIRAVRMRVRVSVVTANQNILAIVGRPNVGKSALFNCIAGQRIAIVHEEAGVTRDRVSARATWRDKQFEIIDTGGIAFMDDEKGGDLIAIASKRQAEVAIEMASALVLVVDVSAGVTPLDLEIARKLRRSGKPVFLAVNKVDNVQRAKNVAEFSELGFEAMFPIAAIHGQGVDGLLEVATADFVAGETTPTARPTKIAIVGRPNVGKSSLINALLKSDRTIVSDIAGTTRDSVDVPFTLAGKDYVLVDTAGLRHRSKINTSVDQFGLMRAERSIRECDVAVLVLDAVAGVTKQDQKIGGQIAEAKRACVILVNKWDLAAEMDAKMHRLKTAGKRQKDFREEYIEALRKELFFLDWAAVLFTSALTGKGVTELFKAIGVIDNEMEKQVETPALNRLLARAIDAYPPSYVGGKRFKIYYAFQKSTRPPRFLLFVNDVGCLTKHYERFLTDKIRATYGYTGCPVVIELRARERKEFVAKPPQKRGSEKKF